MRTLIRCLVAATATCLSSASAFAADVELGKKVAAQCTVCHGKLGVASDPEVPNLAGQSAFYIEKSLKDYQSGARQDRRMSLIAAPLSADDIKNVAAWYASFEVTVTPPPE